MADTLETLEIEVKHKASGAADEIEKLTSAINRLSASLNRVPTKLKNLAAAMDVLKGRAPNITFNDNHTTQVADTITNIKEASSGAKRATSDVAKGIDKMSKSAAKSKSPLGGFLSSLKRIAFYRFIRSIIKAITEAFTEGLKNAYAFSQGITTEGHRFSQAMDSMSSAGLKMKNQLGSAFISLLAAIMPIITQIMALVTKLADALSQLFAAFTGGTYLKAKDVFKEWGDTAESGAKAAKEWKNQILGFDEINRLEAPDDGNGSGGAGGLNPSDMFEDTPLDDWATKIRDSLAAIETAAGGMFLALGLVLLFSGANIPLGLGLIALGALSFTQGLKEDWGAVDPKIASTLANIMAIIGGALLAVGLILLLATPAFSWLGLGLVAAGAAAMASSVAINWNMMPDKVGAVLKSIVPFVGAGLVALGIILMLTGVAVPLGLGMIVAGGAMLAASKNFDWDKITEKVGNCLAKIRGFWEKVEGAISNAWQSVMNFINAINSVDFGKINEMQSSSRYGFGMFASGGFPEEGQMFIARESGAEMVGTIGSRTAVANNDQIVAAIEGGVFRAVSAAMSNGSSRGGNQVAVLNINGREFARAIYADQKTVANEHGGSLIMGI